MKNISIGSRLGVGFAAVLLLTVIIVALAYQGLMAVDDVRQSHQAISQHVALVEQWRNLSRTNMIRVLALAKTSSPKGLRSYFNPQIRETTAALDKLNEEIRNSIVSPAERASFDAAQVKRKDFVDKRDALLTAMESGDNSGVTRVDTELLPLAKDYEQSTAAMLATVTAVAREADEQAAQQARFTRWLLLGMGAAALLLGSVIAWTLTRSVTLPMRRAMADAARLADGDLAVRVVVDRGDELGELQHTLELSRQALCTLVGQIRLNTESIGRSTHEIAQGSQDLSQRTEQAAARLQHTASSMAQITSTVRHSAEAAHKANTMVTTAAEVAERGGTVMARFVTTMDNIQRSSNKIADIIGVIDGIAFQTNILALNAAVEAARAGEQGRGFAVVASEVRGLAARSAAAAKEIKGLIDMSVENVESGSSLVSDAGKAMSEIVESVHRISCVIGEISATAEAQSEGIGAIHASVGALDSMTQQNAALVEQSTAAVESLRDQTQDLTAIVATFQLEAERSQT